jgi:hypothetical protein
MEGRLYGGLLFFSQGWPFVGIVVDDDVDDFRPNLLLPRRFLF